MHWKVANINNLNGALATQIKKYKREYTAAQLQAKELRVTLNEEWLSRNPEGINGKYIAFNIVNGTILYAWIDKKPNGNEPFANSEEIF